MRVDGAAPVDETMVELPQRRVHGVLRCPSGAIRHHVNLLPLTHLLTEPIQTVHLLHLLLHVRGRRRGRISGGRFRRDRHRRSARPGFLPESGPAEAAAGADGASARPPAELRAGATGGAGGLDRVGVGLRLLLHRVGEAGGEEAGVVGGGRSGGDESR